MDLLFLGDSYTCGEGVRFEDSFPSKVSQRLGKQASQCHVVARTGWTTRDLLRAIRNFHFTPPYQYVTLLIGVNNQYQRAPIDMYVSEFTELLEIAIRCAGSKPTAVVVISIPDWSVTPFARNVNRSQVALEIDQYNEINNRISKEYGCSYVNITDNTRAHCGDTFYVTSDGLHPSSMEYETWIDKIVQAMN